MEEDKKEDEEKNKEENKKPDFSRLEIGCDWQCSVDSGTC